MQLSWINNILQLSHKTATSDSLLDLHNLPLVPKSLRRLTAVFSESTTQSSPPSHENSTVRQDKSSWLSVRELCRLCNGIKAKTQPVLSSKTCKQPGQGPASLRSSNTNLPLAHWQSNHTLRAQHLLNWGSWSPDSATCDFCGSWIKHSKTQVYLTTKFFKYCLCYFKSKYMAIPLLQYVSSV